MPANWSVVRVHLAYTDFATQQENNQIYLLNFIIHFKFEISNTLSAWWSVCSFISTKHIEWNITAWFLFWFVFDIFYSWFRPTSRSLLDSETDIYIYRWRDNAILRSSADWTWKANCNRHDKSFSLPHKRFTLHDLLRQSSTCFNFKVLMRFSQVIIMPLFNSLTNLREWKQTKHFTSF